MNEDERDWTDTEFLRMAWQETGREALEPLAVVKVLTTYRGPGYSVLHALAVVNEGVDGTEREVTAELRLVADDVAWVYDVKAGV